MKVALVDTTLSGPLIGGAQTFLTDLATGLVQKGLEVHIITSGQPDCRVADSVVNSGAYLHTDLWPSHYVVQDIAAGFAAWIRDLNPEVYVVSVSWDIGWAVLPLLDPEVATVAIGHGDSPFFYDSIAHYAPYISRAVGVSETVCARLRYDCQMPPERVVWIPCGVYPGAKPPLGRQCGPRRPLRLLYAGRLTDSLKRASDLIRIVKRLDARAIDYCLNVLGDGPLMKTFARRLAKDIATGQVRMHGWLGREDVHRQMREADVFLLTSDAEGLSIALLEAMAHGIVPVVTDIPSGNGEIVRHMKNGMLVPVGGIDDFIESIERLAEDRQLLQKMRISAWESSQAFTVPTMIESYVECFRAAKETVRLSPRMRNPAFPLMGRCRSAYPLWLRRLRAVFNQRVHQLKDSLADLGLLQRRTG
jgi:glycosyltransferase involved in cell wall biosynthesis